MNFNTLEFILLYLPIVIGLTYTVPPTWRLRVLLLASLVFYGISGLLPLAFLIASVLWGYAFALLFRRYHSTGALLAAVSLPLLTLFLGKYLRFTLDTIGAGDAVRTAFAPVLAIALPAGISFYTFKIISYELDVYDGKVKATSSLTLLASFFCLFPHLIAGPILRFADLQQQFTRLATERKLDADWNGAIKFFAIGLFYKTFFADMLRGLHESYPLFAAANNYWDTWYYVLSYAFVIYFDFWGYSLMAIGLAKMVGIDFPRNFREPYMSASPKEFWRRWHITLSFWLRDYVYLKLGGNDRYVRNILIVFLVTGLWHGAGWNFVLWGGYHAVFVLLYHFSRRWWDAWPLLVQRCMTFMVVALGWPLFFLRPEGYVDLLARLFPTNTHWASSFGLHHWLIMGAVAAWTFFIREDKLIFNTDRPRFLDNPVLLGLGAFISVLFLNYARTFIYFQF